MLTFVYRVAAIVVGLLLVLLGIVGIFLPFLQGFLLIALGLSVMSLGSERVASWVRAGKQRVTDAWNRRRRPDTEDSS